MNRTTKLRTNALVALVLTVSHGCSPRDAPGQTVSQRDSAGVTIYENSEGEWTEEAAWRLSSEPTLTTGAFDGPEESLLFQLNGPRRLSNGNILIANASELRFYDPSGTLARSVGREGEGPGDFSLMRRRWLWPLRSDSIAVWDVGNRRFTVFDIDGELGRSFRLDPLMSERRRPTPQGILADNSLLVVIPDMPLEGLRRVTNLYARYSLEGVPLTTLVRRPGWETLAAVTPGGGLVTGAVPYGRGPSVTVFGGRWYYGSSDSWEIEVYSPDGALTHLFRRDEPNRPVTQEMIDEYRDPSLDWGPEILARLAARGVSMPTTEIFPETLPAYRRLMISDDGSLWVENYTLPSEQPSWAVFRDDGRFLGDVETPMGAQVTHIGDDFVLVIWEDELEVRQVVQMYQLIKP